MKNILAENLLRFGVKNLKETNMIRLKSLLTEAPMKLPTPYSIGTVTLLGADSKAKKGTIEKISDTEVKITLDGEPSSNYGVTDYYPGGDKYTFIFKLENDMLDLVSVISHSKDKETGEKKDQELKLSRIKRHFFDKAPVAIRNEQGKLNTYIAPLSFYKIFGLQ